MDEQYSLTCLELTRPPFNDQSDRLHCFQIYSWIDNFVAEHSNLVSKIHIGNSFENRSILVLKVRAYCIRQETRVMSLS